MARLVNSVLEIPRADDPRTMRGNNANGFLNDGEKRGRHGTWNGRGFKCQPVGTSIEDLKAAMEKTRT